MDLYTYVASSNPYQAKAILHKYGYSVRDVKDSTDLGVCLKKLVAYEGEDAFNDILKSHPDVGVILEKNESDKKAPTETYRNFDGCNGSCSCCRNKDKNFTNFNGTNQDSGSSKTVKDVGIYIIAASLLLAAAIIVKK